MISGRCVCVCVCVWVGGWVGVRVLCACVCVCQSKCTSEHTLHRGLIQINAYMHEWFNSLSLHIYITYITNPYNSPTQAHFLVLHTKCVSVCVYVSVVLILYILVIHTSSTP